MLLGCKYGFVIVLGLAFDGVDQTGERGVVGVVIDGRLVVKLGAFLADAPVLLFTVATDGDGKTIGSDPAAIGAAAGVIAALFVVFLAGCG